MTILKLTSENSTNFTCTARNKYGLAQRTTSITVNCKWICWIEPHSKWNWTLDESAHGQLQSIWIISHVTRSVQVVVFFIWIYRSLVLETNVPCQSSWGQMCYIRIFLNCGSDGFKGSVMLLNHSNENESERTWGLAFVKIWREPSFFRKNI